MIHPTRLSIAQNYIRKKAAILTIPETCVDRIIALYHSSFFAGHQGVIKMYLTMSDKFFIPNHIHYLRSYIKGCHLCQLMHNEKPPPRQLQPRINPNYIPYGFKCDAQIS